MGHFFVAHKHKKSKKDYIRKIEELEPKYLEHVKKILDARKSGGFISSMEKELRNWKRKKEEYRRRYQDDSSD